MGVWMFPHFCIKTDNGVELLKSPEVPETNQMHYLTDLFFLEDLRKSLLDMASDSLNIDFFINPNSSDYGDEKFKNICHSPELVRKTIESIRELFATKEDKFKKPYKYQGVVDSKGEKLKNAVYTPLEQVFHKKNIKQSC